jgi:hypothetical protein
MSGRAGNSRLTVYGCHTANHAGFDASRSSSEIDPFSEMPIEAASHRCSFIDFVAENDEDRTQPRRLIRSTMINFTALQLVAW